MVTKSEIRLTLKDGKGKTLFDLTGRRSKVIRSFIKTSIENRWVLKWDVFEIIKHTCQFQNIWEYLAAVDEAEKERRKKNEI
jgi:small-conductance mechanosensitive channel